MKYYYIETWENVTSNGKWKRQFLFTLKETQLSIIEKNNNTNIKQISFFKYLALSFLRAGCLKEYKNFKKKS